MIDIHTEIAHVFHGTLPTSPIYSFKMLISRKYRPFRNVLYRNLLNNGLRAGKCVPSDTDFFWLQVVSRSKIHKIIMYKSDVKVRFF